MCKKETSSGISYQLLSDLSAMRNKFGNITNKSKIVNNKLNTDTCK